MSESWFLAAMFILTAFGCVDGFLRRIHLNRWWALGFLALWIVLPMLLPHLLWAQMLTLLMLATAVAYGAFALSGRGRLMALACFTVATLAALLLRVALPVESGQLAFSINWLWAPAIAACALACTLDQGAALCGSFLAMGAQHAAYSLIAPGLGRAEPFYLGGGFALLVSFAAIASLTQLLFTVMRIAVPPPRVNS